MFKIISYKSSVIDYSIYVKLFSNGTVSYLTFPIDDLLYTKSNDNGFQELKNVFEETFESRHRKVPFWNILILG